MGEEKQMNPQKRYFYLSLIVCMVATILNVLLILPGVYERAQCANECNAKLQACYDEAMAQGLLHKTPVLGVEANLSGANYPLPASNDWGNPVYVPIEELVEDGE
jgi:hypothetical protein